jgi:hypothetical protein
MQNDAERTKDLLKRIQQLGEKSTQLLIFLSFAFVAVVALKSQRISELQQKSLTCAMRSWAVALPLILFGVFPVRDFAELSQYKVWWYNRIRWIKVAFLILAVILVLLGAWFFGCAIWPAGHPAEVPTLEY